MTSSPSDHWPRVRDLFERALDVAPAERTAFFAAERDPALVEEVRSLLSHHASAGAFMDGPLVEREPALFDDEEPIEAGTALGPYEVVREIGRGGMGRVYLASDRRLNRRVALKALPSRLADDPARRERLRREARAAAALTHPGICTVHALEEHDGLLFIVSEYVDGRTLRQEIGTGRRPTPYEVATTARELAAALASAHAKGIAHRDLKPENVMRTADGRTKILDFGVARFESHVHRTTTMDGAPLVVDGVAGTPAYMSPEQLNGLPGDVTSDVFAFGVLLYEYATGVHPFDADTPLAMMARVLERDPAPLTTIRPDIPTAVAHAVDRCLRKEPGDRWPSATDVALALAHEDRAQPKAASTDWWRTHQLVIMAVYCGACTTAWQIKEWIHGLTDPAFIAMGVASAIAGVLRGHLVFTDWVNAAAIASERRRLEPITLVTDLAIATILGVAGAVTARTHPLVGMLTMALAAVILLARVVLEPATARAAFGSPPAPSR